MHARVQARSSHWGVLPSEDTWHCLVTFLIVTRREGCWDHAAGIWWGEVRDAAGLPPAFTTLPHRDSPDHNIDSSQIEKN